MSIFVVFKWKKLEQNDPLLGRRWWRGRGEGEDDQWRKVGCRDCIPVSDVEEKEERTGNTWVPPAFSLSLFHQLRLMGGICIKCPMPSGYPWDQPVGSPGRGLVGAGREKQKYLVGLVPPHGVAFGWLLPSLCNPWSLLLSKWPSSHPLHWDSKSLSSSSARCPLLLSAPEDTLLPGAPYIPPKSS